MGIEDRNIGVAAGVRMDSASCLFSSAVIIWPREKLYMTEHDELWEESRGEKSAYDI